METHLIISFIGASVLLIFMPGPDNIFVLTESLTKGHRNGIAISVGLCLGIMIHTTAAATGLSIIIQKSAEVFALIKYMGAFYLFYLAYKATKENNPSVVLNKDDNNERHSILKLVRKGLFMNVLNPKVALFFIAFLPQFTTNNGLNITIQMIILGLIFMTLSLVIFFLISMLSGRLSYYLNSSRFWKITKWSKVSILSLLGCTLGLSQK